MIIERTKKEVIIRLAADIDIDTLQDMADWFQYMEISKKSKATQSAVDTLVKQVKKNRWAKTKVAILK